MNWLTVLNFFVFVRKLFESPIKYRCHQEQQGLAAYGQWGKIKTLPTTSSAFQREFFFHDYADCKPTIGNGLAYEAQLELDFVKKLRSVPMKMSVLQLLISGGRGYMFFFQIPEFGTLQKTIETVRRGLITFGPFHAVDVQDLEEGEKLPRDNPKGWDKSYFLSHSFPTWNTSDNF